MVVINNTPIRRLCYNISMSRKKPAKGFTLIELSLSMVFISMLSLAIVLIIMNTISSYRRGLTMNQVNSVGEELIDDIRVAIQNSPSGSVSSKCGARYGDDVSSRTYCEDDRGKYLVSVSSVQSVKIDKESTATEVPVYGAICTGRYSYIWNSGYAFSENATLNGGGAITRASLTVDKTEYSNFRLIKVSDDNRTICTQNIGSYPSPSRSFTVNPKFVISGSQSGSSEPVELIDKDGELAVYDLNMMPPAESNDGTNLFYSGSLVLGTIRGGPSISNSSCKAPDSEFSDLDYCAINKFNFAVQANGSGGA